MTRLVCLELVVDDYADEDVVAAADDESSFSETDVAHVEASTRQ